MAVVLEATVRKKTGSRDARSVREQGLVPCVIYGHGETPVSVAISAHDIDLAIEHGERWLEVKVEGQKETVLIKDAQWDVYGQDLLHVDLTRVNLDEKVSLTVPVILQGTPKAAEEGGVLQQQATEVEVECMVRNIPDEITYDVKDMEIGDSLHASDLTLPEGSTMESDPETLICTITFAQEEEEPEEGEELVAAEPEVIGEKTEEGEEAAEEEEQSE